jgi:glycosyltransferase involved in cell wall biosynthesis
MVIPIISNESPKVSIIIPVFNEPETTLMQSLMSIVNQTFTDYECIVVDESSRIESSLACKKICEMDARFSYFKPKERLGLSGSLNFALSSAKGELIARFDSDDVCLPNRLELQVAFTNHRC